jgi:radical SAM protein with 4Fe4S-binding SPASM domain
MGRLLLDYQRRRDVVASPPIRMWVESSSHCNLRCPMCHNRDMPADRKGHMDFDLFRKIVDEARGFVNDIYLHHRGEPLLNPRIFDMIRYAREAGIKTRFHTNGALLDEEKAVRLLAAAPDLVSFSIDGFYKEGYERVRVGATFENTVENVLRLLALRKRAGAAKPYVVVERIRFRAPESAERGQAVVELAERFRAAGVDEVIEKEEYVWATPSAPDLAVPRRGAACTFPWYAMVILWDGTVTPCPQDYNGELRMGDAKTSSLREIWNGPAYRELRRQMATDVGALRLCRKCDRLTRKTVAGLPVQYMVTFLVDQLVGYSRFRKRIGTRERNA